MKIALISARRDPFISPHDMDGGCVVLRNYILELSKLGHEITIFTRAEKINTYSSNKQNAKAILQIKSGLGKININNGITIYRIPYKEVTKDIEPDKKEILEAKYFTSSLKKYLKCENFDIYHYFHLHSISGWIINKNAIPYLDKSIFSPLLITAGRTFEYNSRERLKLEKEVFNKINFIVCQSDGEINSIIHHYKLSKQKLFKIPLGVNKKLFKPKEIFFKNKKIIIINPNSIKPQKRQHDVVKMQLS